MTTTDKAAIEGLIAAIAKHRELTQAGSPHALTEAAWNAISMRACEATEALQRLLSGETREAVAGEHSKDCRSLITKVGNVPLNDYKLPCTCGADSPDVLVRMAHCWLTEYIKNTGIEPNVCAYDLLTYINARNGKDAVILKHGEIGVATGTNIAQSPHDDAGAVAQPVEQKIAEIENISAAVNALCDYLIACDGHFSGEGIQRVISPYFYTHAPQTAAPATQEDEP